MIAYPPAAKAPLLDAQAAENHAIKIFGEDNVFKRISIHKGGQAEGGIVVEGFYTVGHQEQLYIEPQGMIAVPREDGGLLYISSVVVLVVELCKMGICLGVIAWQGDIAPALRHHIWVEREQTVRTIS